MKHICTCTAARVMHEKTCPMVQTNQWEPRRTDKFVVYWEPFPSYLMCGISGVGECAVKVTVYVTADADIDEMLNPSWKDNVPPIRVALLNQVGEITYEYWFKDLKFNSAVMRDLNWGNDGGLTITYCLADLSE